MGTVDFDSSWRNGDEERTRERRVSKVVKTRCPECDATVAVNRPRIGDEVVCRECGAYLEVVSVDPFEVDYPYGDDVGDGYDDDY